MLTIEILNCDNWMAVVPELCKLNTELKSIVYYIYNVYKFSRKQTITRPYMQNFGEFTKSCLHEWFIQTCKSPFGAASKWTFIHIPNNTDNLYIYSIYTSVNYKMMSMGTIAITNEFLGPYLIEASLAFQTFTKA